MGKPVLHLFVFDLDRVNIPIQCPKCDFDNYVTMAQVRLNDVVICRGCKSNIQLVDYMGTVSKSRETLDNSLRRLMGSLPRGFTVTLRF